MYSDQFMSKPTDSNSGNFVPGDRVSKGQVIWKIYCVGGKTD